MSLSEELYQVADHLRGLANVGLLFSESRYERERLEGVLAASARIVAALERRPAEEVLACYRGNMAHVSPWIGAEAAVWRQGKLLLVRREDDGLWAVPGGLTEVGETLAESACRELREETGLRGWATRLLGIFDSRLWQSQLKVQLYHVVLQVGCEEGTPVAGPETTGARFFGAEELPALSAGHQLRVPLLFRQQRGEAPVPFLDGLGALAGLRGLSAH